MPDNLTLGAVHNIAQKKATLQKDVILPASSMGFDGIEWLNIGGSQYKLRTHAQQQICSRLKIPHQYLIRCGERVQDENIRHWLDREPDSRKFLVRLEGGEVRAIFTDKYQPVNHVDVLQELIAQYGENQETQTMFGENILTLNMVNPNREIVVAQNDRLHPGVSITNSETGFRPFSVAKFILRLVCTNGLIAFKRELGIKVRHVVSKFFERHSLARIIEMAKNDNGHYEQLLQKAAIQPVKEPPKMFAQLDKQFQLDSAERTAVQTGFDLEPGETMYHIINAYTRGSQDRSLVPEQQYHLQQVGGLALGLVRL